MTRGLSETDQPARLDRALLGRDRHIPSPVSRGTHCLCLVFLIPETIQDAVERLKVQPFESRSRGRLVRTPDRQHVEGNKLHAGRLERRPQASVKSSERAPSCPSPTPSTLPI